MTWRHPLLFLRQTVLYSYIVVRTSSLHHFIRMLVGTLKVVFTLDSHGRIGVLTLLT